MTPALLFRADADTEAELAAARRHGPVLLDRRDCHDRLVIGRYSVLPFYDALEADLADRGCRLVNTFDQHRWVADFRYYPLVADLTPESGSDAEFDAAPDKPIGRVQPLGARCRCGHEWLPRGGEEPRVCPKCKSANWDRPKFYERKSAGGDV